MLISSSVPRILWVEAVLTAVNLINITPSSVLAGKTPHEHFYSSPPDYSMLCTFGCTCYDLFPPNERTKLSDRSAKCILLDISSKHNGYHCYDPLTRRLLISPSLRTLLIFHLQLRIYTFCLHLIHHLLSFLDFLLI